jgi:hypothetical protein
MQFEEGTLADQINRAQTGGRAPGRFVEVVRGRYAVGATGR